MELKLVFQNARCVVVELTEAGKYYTEKEYKIYANGELKANHNHVISSLYDLKPDTDYEITVEYEGEAVAPLKVHTDYQYVTLNVRDFGAQGDGEHDDTNAIQAAIMACPKNSRILVPAGTYKIVSVFLKSDITLELAKGATLSAFTDRTKFPIFPGTIDTYDETDEYNLGTWEGNPLDTFSGIITAINAENITITGEGVIDGCADFDNWWFEPKIRKIAWRPRLVFISHCKNVILQGITVKNSPSWTLHPYFSENLRFIDIKIQNPFNSHNTDGLDPESCNHVEVIGAYISVGDDCIALKSGKIYMAKKLGIPMQNMLVRNCCMRDGHGSVTIGSEIAAGVKNITIKDCQFIHTDRGLRVKTRRGRGERSILDQITFENIDMDQVMTPFVVNSFYFCDPDGRTDYVGSMEPYPVDDRTPSIKRLTFKNIEAKNCHVAAAYITGLPENKIECLTFENIHVTYAEDAKSGVAAMMTECKESCKAGIFALNAKKLVLKNVKVEGCEGEAIIAKNVDFIEK